MRTELSYVSGGCAKTETRELPDAEQLFWREVASVLPALDIPSTYRIRAFGPDGSCAGAELEITERGTYMKDGAEVPSMFVIPVYNDIALEAGDYEDAYLTCINPDTRGHRGNYKFYRLTQRQDGSVTAFYGRIGQTRGFGAEREIKEPMPSWMFEVRKAEKMTKGYVDRTETYCDENAHVAGGAVAAREVADNLYQRLLAFARRRVEASLAQGTVVTNAQVDECYDLLKRLGRCRRVDSFNERLLNLMSVSPRNVASVSAELARSADDFARIIDREESLYAAMRAVAADNTAPKSKKRDGFKANGIGWEELSGEGLSSALGHLPADLRGKVRRVYAVEHAEQRRRFAQYLDARGLGESDVRLMWHGSRNENWCGIVTSSLMLNPNAQITGKMFGYGIYFGYDENDGGAYKSWNYTSGRGSYWARGNSDTAFMGLFECAYGTPHHPRRAGSFEQPWLDARGFDCVHARGGDCGLRHDEVVFYDEAAVCIKYLYEFAA